MRTARQQQTQAQRAANRAHDRAMAQRTERLEAGEAQPPFISLRLMRQQWLAVKRQYPQVVVFVSDGGDFYETFDEDAALCERERLLTAQRVGRDRLLIAGIPQMAARDLVALLLTRGHTAALCDQVNG